MSKVLVLAESGFGKTSSIGPIHKEDFEKAGIKGTEIKGLNPKDTFIISVANKGLPIPQWKKMYNTVPVAEFMAKGVGNRVISNDAIAIAKVIKLVAERRGDINNIVLDDTNYVMQDYYMDKAATTGYDVFKKIGAQMGGIFNAMELVDSTKKNFFMLAHHEEYKNSNFDTISFRFKTVGKMVQDYITPEGKFEVVLFGKQTIEDDGDGGKTLKKVFVTNFDGWFPAKSPVGMFHSVYVPNDLGIVADAIREYEG